MDQTPGQKLSRWLQNEFRPKNLLPSLTSGIVLGISEVIFAISLGSLVFSGKLAVYFPYGVGAALVTAATVMIVTALTSKIPGVIGSTQDGSSVILAVIAAALVGAVRVTSSQGLLATVLVAISLTTLLTGIVFLTLGFFKLGGLVRFVPYPVVGGFLAGTGWLLATGSFGVMTQYSLNLANLPALFQSAQLIQWIPGVLFALALFFGLRRFQHFLAMPAILLGSIAVFYLVLLVTGTSIESATTQGLLLGKVSGEAIWQPLALNNLLTADWAAIFGQGGNILITLTLSLVGLLLNASALELAIQKDVDLSHELKSAGLANFLSGLGGGLIGYHALSLSTLSHRIGARGRLPGLVAGAICAVMLFAGSALLALFPKPLLGGLLLFLGLDFLVEWVIASWAKLSRSEYAIVLLILVIIASTDFLVGVGVGLVAMVILFVLNYSRIDVVHLALSGAELSSNVERCAYHRRALTDLGKHTYILELDGFLFFGTANALLEKMRARVADASQPKTLFIILDFRRVTGLDSSAVLSFTKGRNMVETQGITLVLTHVSPHIQRQLALGGLTENDSKLRFFADLDHGLEWCEEQLLEMERITTLHVPITLSAQLADSGFKKTDTARLLPFLERLTIQQGDYLLRQGEEADKLYFIEMGTVSVYLEMGSTERVRLQTLGLGTAIGEPGLYLNTICATSVIADSAVTAYRLTRPALAEMKAREPELAATFHEFAARLLSERLAATTRTLEAMLK
jgi:SulP family sulfate permease